MDKTRELLRELGVEIDPSQMGDDSATADSGSEDDTEEDDQSDLEDEEEEDTEPHSASLNDLQLQNEQERSQLMSLIQNASSTLSSIMQNHPEIETKPEARTSIKIPVVQTSSSEKALSSGKRSSKRSVDVKISVNSAPVSDPKVPEKASSSKTKSIPSSNLSVTPEKFEFESVSPGDSGKREKRRKSVFDNSDERPKKVKKLAGSAAQGATGLIVSEKREKRLQHRRELIAQVKKSNKSLSKEYGHMKQPQPTLLEASAHLRLLSMNARSLHRAMSGPVSADTPQHNAESTLYCMLDYLTCCLGSLLPLLNKLPVFRDQPAPPIEEASLRSTLDDLAYILPATPDGPPGVG